MAAAIMAIFLAACTATPAGGEAEQTPRPPVVTWAEDCEQPEDPPSYVAILEMSASESNTMILEERLRLIGLHASQAADCEADLTVALIVDGSRTQVLFTETLTSELGTEIARDNQISSQVIDILTAITQALDQAIASSDGPSNPGHAYRFLAEQLARLEPDGTIDALVLSDGISTADVNLNRSLASDDLTALAMDIAPQVDLESRVAIDWRGLGQTTDPVGPPAAWLEDLISVWVRACQLRNATSCLHTTT